MEGINTLGNFIAELTNLASEHDAWDKPVMIAVVKYPEEFGVRIRDGKATWTDRTDVECHPLEEGEVTLIDGIVHIAVELEDYDEQRHFAGG